MVSAIILTKNNEDVLEDCLKSLKNFAEEIIVIDSGSLDKTIEIAKKYNAKIFHHKLVTFANQRNFGFSKSSGEWIFYIDSDERITNGFSKEAKEKISSFLEDSHVAGFFVKRDTYFLGKKWGMIDQVQRIFYRKHFDRWIGDVHETPKVNGEFDVINSPIHHFTHRNLEQMVEKTNSWSEIEARLRLESSHPQITWWRFPRVMISGFLKSYIKEKGYKNGTQGVIESTFQAFSMYVTYAKLWELQRK